MLPGDFFVNDVVSFFVDHHQLVPGPLQVVRLKIPVDIFSGIFQKSFDLPERVDHLLLLVQPVQKINRLIQQNIIFTYFNP